MFQRVLRILVIIQTYYSDHFSCSMSHRNHSKHCVYNAHFNCLQTSEDNDTKSLTMPFVSRDKKSYNTNLFLISNTCIWISTAVEVKLLCAAGTSIDILNSKTFTSPGVLLNTSVLSSRLFSYKNKDWKCRGASLNTLLSLKMTSQKVVTLFLDGISKTVDPLTGQNMIKLFYNHHFNETIFLRKYGAQTYIDDSQCVYVQVTHRDGYRVCSNILCRTKVVLCEYFNMSCVESTTVLSRLDVHLKPLTPVEVVCISVASVILFAVLSVIVRSKYYNGEICQQRHSETCSFTLDEIELIDEFSFDVNGELSCYVCTANACDEHGNRHARIDR